jgi:hypothetical protein
VAPQRWRCAVLEPLPARWSFAGPMVWLTPISERTIGSLRFRANLDRMIVALARLLSPLNEHCFRLPLRVNSSPACPPAATRQLRCLAVRAHLGRVDGRSGSLESGRISLKPLGRAGCAARLRRT